MKKYILYLWIVTGFCFSAHSFADPVTDALKKLKNNHPKEARGKLNKVLRKNSQNAGAHYVYSLYFLQQYHTATISGQPTASVAPSADNFNGQGSFLYLDSAYVHVLQAIDYFPPSKPASIRKWIHAGVTWEVIQDKKLEIDNLAFSNASYQHNIASYQYFIEHFPTARQQDTAVARRNELAYAEASRINTYNSYKKFLDTYPNAKQAHEAEQLYELLLFEFLTRDNDITSYEKFLEIQPTSPYRDEAERRIYELMTTDHSRQSYIDFVRRYPKNSFTQQAWYWVYSLYQRENNTTEDFLTHYPDFLDKEYVQKRAETESLAYFPVYDEEISRYGFIDANGVIQVPTKYDSVAANYFCDGVKDNIMLVYWQNRMGAVDKTGREVTGFGFQDVEQLDRELILVKQNNKVGIWHEAGFPVLPVQYDQIERLNDNFLIVKQDTKYGLVNFFGSKITETVYEEIKNLEDGLVAFRQNNKYAIVRNDSLSQKRLPPMEFLYDGVEWVKEDALRVKTGDTESIVDRDLQVIIPSAPAHMKPLMMGWEVAYADHKKLLDTKGKMLADSVGDIVSNTSFYAVRKDNRWAIWKTSIAPRLKFDYDTVMLLGREGFAVKKSSANNPNGVYYAFFTPDIFLKIGSYQNVTLLQSDEGAGRRWIIMEDKEGKKGLLSFKGQQILPVKYDKIVLWTGDWIAIQENDKWGLIDGTGKVILPVVYQGLSYANGFVTTFKNGTFGLLHLGRGIDIAPQYERIIRPYTDNSLLFIAAKKDKYGFINADNEAVSAFDFDEIRYWQYGVALVKRDYQWHFYHIAEKKFVFKALDDFQYIRNDNSEIILRMYANRQYGILSNTRGIVVDFEYDDLRNVGTAEVPFYMAEKYIENADVYLVFYIDRFGKKVRKQIFDQTRYEKIVCD